MPPPSDDEAKVVCHALLKRIFRELVPEANSLSKDVDQDEGPNPESATELLPKARKLYHDVWSFLSVKQCFPYHNISETVQELVGLLRQIETDANGVVRILKEIIDAKPSTPGPVTRFLRRFGSWTQPSGTASGSVSESTRAPIQQLLNNIVKNAELGYQKTFDLS
jgi:hypothetical protein